MKEYHVTGNQRIKGTFELHVYQTASGKTNGLKPVG